MVPEVPDVVTLAVPLFVLGIVVEMVLAVKVGEVRFELRDSMASLAMGVGNIVEGLVFGFVVVGAQLAVYELTPLRQGFGLGAFAMAFVLNEFRYYWWHRWAHEIRWLWSSHVVHHSSQHYNLTTALRQPWTSTFTLAWVLSLPLAALGFHPVLLGLCGGLNLVYQYWIHTEAIGRLPRGLEAVFNTPSHHRVHHATNPDYLDSNYGGTFIVFDRWFGTFVPERDDEPCRYGIVKNLGTFSPLRIALHETLAILRDVTRPGLRLSHRFWYAFGRPGWSHDGSRKTSLMLKQDHARRRQGSE